MKKNISPAPPALLADLRKFIRQAGSLREAAKQLGYCFGHIRDMANGTVTMNAEVAKRLGWKCVVEWKKCRE